MPCKSQFTVQTPPNNCCEKQVCNMVNMQWLIVPQERQICTHESALSLWALSNVIEYEMKFHFRWHQIERRSSEKKVASSTLPLTISSVESNQVGMRLKFLVSFLPHSLTHLSLSFIIWDHDKCRRQVRRSFSFFNHEYLFSCQDKWARWEERRGEIEKKGNEEDKEIEMKQDFSWLLLKKLKKPHY